MIVGSLFSKRPRETGSNCNVSCFASAFFGAADCGFDSGLATWTNLAPVFAPRIQYGEASILRRHGPERVHLNALAPVKSLSEEVRKLPRASKVPV